MLNIAPTIYIDDLTCSSVRHVRARVEYLNCSQVISLVQENAFSPRPIRRELRSILHLLDDRNFKDVKLEDNGTVDAKAIREWMTPLMANYCVVFGMQCNRYDG